MRIGVDALGGDYAPQEAIKGCIQARESIPGLEVVLFGPSDIIESEIVSQGGNPADFTIVHAPDTIGMHEHAVKSVSSKPNSSINVGMTALAKGAVDAFVSAGNTGAMYVSALYIVKAIEGIQRPALSSILPRPNGNHGLLLDVGANADCKPEVLSQFALLGSVYSANVNHISNPRVALLNIGEEEEKGNLLSKEAHQVMKAAGTYNFVGNVEGRDIFSDQSCDVVVCDGFTGNVVVKVCEGMFYQFMKRGIQDEYLDKFNFKHYGGTPILGVNKPVIIGHGISKAETFVNMIRLGAEVHSSGLIDKIRDAVAGSQAAATE